TRGGQPVAGLTARDFALADNGVAQEVDSVMLDRLPLSVTMVLDTSESVAGDRLSHLVQAGDGLTAALRGDDQAALITFSNLVDLRTAMTGDLAAVRSSLQSMRGAAGTSLRHTSQLAPGLQPHDPPRPAVLACTD